MLYCSCEIWPMTDVIAIFHFGLFLPFYPSDSPKNENFKKVKKRLEISFYISVPKIMIMCYTVPEIWHMTHVIVIFLIGLFFVVLGGGGGGGVFFFHFTPPPPPPNSPKNHNFKIMKKTPGDIIILHMYHKL